MTLHKHSLQHIFDKSLSLNKYQINPGQVSIALFALNPSSNVKWTSYELHSVTEELVLSMNLKIHLGLIVSALKLLK